MSRFNNGIVLTNNNCNACNKCISECDVIGANVCSEINGKRIISVNNSKCSHCGKCLSVCDQNARDYRDDTDALFEALKNGEKVSVIVDQTFYLIYGDKAQNVIAWLKQQGVEKVYDLAYGAEISLWAHVKYLVDNQNLPPQKKAFIANACSSFVNEVELYDPGLRYKIIPVQSPVICTAIYVKKYLGDSNKLAVLGSCVAHKDEYENPNTHKSVTYNITYKHLGKYLDENNLPQTKVESDLTTNEFGNVMCGEGVFADSAKMFFSPRERFVTFNGDTRKIFNHLDFFMNGEYAVNQPFFAEIYSCKHGCQMGPVFDSSRMEYPYIYTWFAKKYQDCMSLHEGSIFDYEKNRKFLFEHFKDLDYSDFERVFVNRYKQSYKVPDDVYEEIYKAMLKDTPEKRHINCGSCGYASCQEMAEALAFGYNQKENCIHYMNDIMEKNYYTDNLTGLDNIAGLERKVQNFFASSINKQYALYIGDVNKLTVINDIFGYEKGNAVVKTIASNLSKAAGDKGVAARIGGGVFAVFMEYNFETAELLRNIKYFDCSHLGIQMPVTVRFGIYVTDETECSLTDMINYATLCMNNDINTTANTFSFFTQEFREKMMHEVSVTSQMPVALRNDEFQLWFQPQYKAGSGELVGAEALCRWIKPDRSIIPPDSFIPISEKNGLIITLDKIIWRKAFEKMRQWIDSEINPVPLSINISRVSLESDSLIYAIKRLDEEFNIPHNLIHFEITESACTKDVKSLIDRINRIRDLGFEIAMDDFGSGYSSLNSLKDIPIDMIKLDMGFLKSTGNMDKGGNIISSVVHMAQSLELITIAEGVETNAQANFLTSVGCDIIQGFLYSKPLPEEEYVQLMSQSKERITVEKPHVFGNLNINNFYNPDSGENLMFEQFTGPAAIFEFDDLEYRAKLIRVNNKTLTLFDAEGISISEISNNIRTFFSSENRRLILDTMQSVLDTGKEKYCVSECYCVKSKTPVWVKFRYWLLSSNDHKYMMYCLMEDLTEEKITENTLTTTNAQMAMLMENSSVGLLLMHVTIDFKRPFESVKTRILKYNQNFVKVSGFPEEEVAKWTEKELTSIVHPFDRPKFWAKLLKGFTDNFNTPVTCVYRARHKDGHWCKVQMILTGLKQDNGTYFLATNYITLEDNLTGVEEADDSGNVFPV